MLLRSGQLVGAALLIFVKEEALREIKNVEGGVIKVRLSSRSIYAIIQSRLLTP